MWAQENGTKLQLENGDWRMENGGVSAPVSFSASSPVSFRVFCVGAVWHAIALAQVLWLESNWKKNEGKTVKNCTEKNAFKFENYVWVNNELLHFL